MRTREELENIGCRILGEMRTELYLSLRAMGPALDALSFRLDLSTRTIGTDAESIRFNPTHVLQLFLNRPRRLLRTYMHMLLHCLLRHPFQKKKWDDPELYDLCADISAELLLDTLQIDTLFELPTDFRSEWTEKFQETLPVVTAEQLYRYFTEQPPDILLREKLAREFTRDDHSFWERMNKDQDPPGEPPESTWRQREQDWDDRAKNTREQMAVTGNEASDEKGSLDWMLSLQTASRTDYRDFLRRFFTLKEELRIDPDSFDYAYYTYGMEMFGNIPLLEENEYRESAGVEQLVIAIDTSASTRPVLVKQFLEETASILSSRDTFLHQMELHIIECDDQVQRDTVLKRPQDLLRYAGELSVKGGMGTDFRPVFSYIREKQRRGELLGLRGLLYFTDGYGTYPTEPTAYDTAFVFCTGEAYDDRKVPDWALRLYAGEGEYYEYKGSETGDPSHH